MPNQYTKGNGIAETYPELLEKWDYKKNVGTNPKTTAR